MLARACVEAGHPTQVVSFKRQYPAWLYPGETDKDPSRKPIVTEAEYLLDPVYPWTWIQAARRILAYEPDVVAIQWWTTFWGPGFAAVSRLLRSRGKRLIYIIHNVLPHEQRAVDRRLARMALASSDAFITQTDRERQRLLALLPEATIYSCPLPAYHLLHQDGLTRAEARQKLGLDGEQYLLLFFGFVRPYKGVQVLLEALHALRRRGLCPTLAIVGEFWQDKTEYLAQIKHLGLEAQVRIEGRYVPDEEIEPWFRAADCLVAPYIAGTQSAATGIALAYGLPMIVSRQVAEGIADENHAALLGVVPPGDAEALAEAISQAMIRPERKQSPVRTPAGDDWQQLVSMLAQIAGGKDEPGSEVG